MSGARAVGAIPLPPPVSWGVDLLGGAASKVAGWSFAKVTEGVAGWVSTSVGDVTGAVARALSEGTSPRPTAAWFTGGPYRTMATLAGVVLVAMILVAVVQGVVSGEAGQMARGLVVHVPAAVIGITALTGATELLIGITDALSGGLLRVSGGDVTGFVAAVAAGGTAAKASTGLVVVLLGLFTLLAGLVVLVELVIREALIYLVVGLAPLAFAALVWPATRSALRRTLELLVALILSKLVIAFALSVGAAALAGTNGPAPPSPRGPVITEPGTPGPAGTGAGGGGDGAARAGTLVVAVAVLAMAGFSPLLVTRLVPAAEAAVVAHGVRGGAARQVGATSRTLHRNAAARAGSAPPRPPGGAGPAPPRPSAGGSRPAPSSASPGGAAGASGASGPGAAGAAGAGAAAAGSGAAVAAVGAAKGTVDAARARAETAVGVHSDRPSPSSSGSPGGSGPSARSRR